MAKGKSIVTSLLEQRVQMTFGTALTKENLDQVERLTGHMRHLGKFATIKTVFYDSEGSIMYTVKIDGVDKLVDVYSHAFRLVDDESDPKYAIR